MEQRAFITEMGICAPGIKSITDVKKIMEGRETAISNISIFPVDKKNPQEVGEIKDFQSNTDFPRTHELAWQAVKQILDKKAFKPDAILIGVTTGGMLKTEDLIKKNDFDPSKYKCHGAGTVADFLARKLDVKCKSITVSTACSSGAVVLKLALDMIRKNEARTILVGGVDSLSRLTFYGFNSLQLISSKGVSPLDRDRSGMTVAEGAGMLLVEGAGKEPEEYYSEILGGGVTCDAYHPASPDPSGDGAARAMNLALEDASLACSEIDYINLHGTATKDNDRSECRAIKKVYGDDLPPFSSIKGFTGHSLAAAGAIEAIISSDAIKNSYLPLNYGFQNIDDEIGIEPVTDIRNGKVNKVMSNSLGFGGNNASIILGKKSECGQSGLSKERYYFKVQSYDCVTGAGRLENTFSLLNSGKKVDLLISESDLTEGIPKKLLRRLKRLPKICFSLISDIYKKEENIDIDSVYLGTGWGAVSETWDFLKSLYDTNEQFVSPTDFIGSVHNAPAGHMGMYCKSKGANITTTDGNYSFEQALLAARVLTFSTKEILLIGADEYHSEFSNILDLSVSNSTSKTDGGAAFILKPQKSKEGLIIDLLAYEKNCDDKPFSFDKLQNLNMSDCNSENYPVIFVGIPDESRELCEKQLNQFLKITSYDGLIIDYRKFLGEFATVSSVATALAVDILKAKRIPSVYCKALEPDKLSQILLVNLGETIAITEVTNNG